MNGTTRRARTMATAAALALALAACAGDDTAGDPTPQPTDDATTAAPTEAATASGEADATITIRDFSFGEPVAVPAGATIEVVNEDGTAHTWTADDGTFDSGSLSPDASFTYVADTEGTFDFACTIHPSMTGTLTVGGDGG